jgi:Putative MetA-pathway of phenol degradation
MFCKHRWHIPIIAMTGWFLLTALLLTGRAFAHDPVFSPGPHVLFKDGVETNVEFARSEQGDETENEQAIELKYGITGDWVAGIELPYQTHRNDVGSQSGIGDITFSTKYRFWRNDTLGAQESAAVLLKVKLDSSDDEVATDTTDSLLGFAYGYESLKWYRWASVRYRFNQNKANLQRGDRWFVDLAGGYRPQVNNYREADTVWLLELNGEYGKRSALNGIDIGGSGGNQWFISPGIMWTLRNFAVKAGVQIPVYSALNGAQSRADYRARLEFEWHF